MSKESVTSIVQQIEQIFEELDQRRKAGKIAFDDFQQELDKLKVEDAEGNLWALAADGNWYKWQDGDWVPGSPSPAVRAINLDAIVTLAEAMGVLIDVVEKMVPDQEEDKEEEKHERNHRKRNRVSIGRVVLSILRIFFALLMLAVGLLSVLREEASTIVWATATSLGFLAIVIGLVVAMKREAREYSFERKIRRWAWVSVTTGVLVSLFATGFWAISNGALPSPVARTTSAPTTTPLAVLDTPRPIPTSAPTATPFPTAIATPLSTFTPPASLPPVVTTTAPAMTPPPPPADLRGEAISKTQINLSWYSDTQDLTGFAIYRDSVQVAMVDPAATTYQDSGLQCGTTYSYEVRTVNTAGISEIGAIIQVTTSSCPPTSPSFSGLLAYPVFNVSEQTFDIHITDVTTEAQVRVIEGASQPDVRPDGREIVYRGWDGDTRGLWVEPLKGGDRWHASTSHEAARPAWNFQGTQFVFASDQAVDRTWQLYFPGGADGMGDPISHGGSGETPAWLPDGRLLFKGCRGTGCGISVVNPDGANATFLTTDSRDRAPTASPGGAHIVFMSDRDGIWDLYLMNADGSTLRRLTNDPARDTSPIWSPDGQWIAFVSDREAGNWLIWVIRPDGTDLQRLSQIGEDLGLDGQVVGVPDYQRAGWMDERISWVQP